LLAAHFSAPHSFAKHQPGHRRQSELNGALRAQAERETSGEMNRQDATIAALRQVIEPLAELAVHNGVPCATVEESVRRAFVVRMLQFLGSNLGDHAAGAVANVLTDGRRHFEQAVFADGLTQGSVREVWAEIGDLWKGLLAALIPLLEQKVERDSPSDGATQRVRVGLYTFDVDTAAAANGSVAPPERKNQP
jgi:hypothetical protein